MNIHNMIRGAINKVNPDQEVIILKNLGQEHFRGGVVKPRYKMIKVTAQVQPSNSNDISFENNHVMSGFYLDFWLNEKVDGLCRTEGTGGDMLVYENFIYYIDGNPEQWNTVGWNRVTGVRQTKTLDDFKPFIEEIENEDNED